MADTVDEISGGRLILGLGAGWHEPEYQRLRLPVRPPGQPLRGGAADHPRPAAHGAGRLRGDATTRRASASCARAARVRRGRRSWSARTGPRMLRLTARYADGWNTYFNRHQNNPAGIPALRETVDAACIEHGRDPATLERTCAVLVSFDGDTSPPSSANPAARHPSQDRRKRSPPPSAPSPPRASPTSRSGWSRTTLPASRRSFQCWSCWTQVRPGHRAEKLQLLAGSLQW